MFNQLKHVTLSRRIILSTLLIGIVPLLLLSALISIQLQESIEKETQIKLSIATTAKQDFIEQYFRTLDDQIKMLAQNQITINAMKDLGHSSHFMKEENETTDVELAQMRQAVGEFYQTTVLTKLKEENEISHINLRSLSQDLSQDTIVQQYHYIVKNPNFLGEKSLLNRANDNSSYSTHHEKYHPYFRSFLKRFAFFDIFLVDHRNGKIIYSVEKEIEYGAYLYSPILKKSSLYRTIVDAAKLSKGETLLVDFQKHLLSPNLPVAFIATPIYDGEELIGELIFQISLDKINEKMTENIHIGQTGETLLIGEDGLFRSDSQLKPNSHSALASFKNPIDKNFRDPTLLRCFHQSSADLLKIKDYRNKDTLIAVKRLDMGTFKYLLLAKIDAKEAYQPVKDIQQLIGITTLLLSAIVITLTLQLSRSITTPLSQLTTRLKALADGNLHQESYTDLPNNELGELRSAYNDVSQQLQILVTSTQSYTSKLKTTAGALLTTAQMQKTGTAEQVSAAKETKERLTLLLKSSKEVAEVSRLVFNNADITQKNALLIATRIDELSGHVERIGEILILIKDIATKSDLLALNASLEGSKAGDAGRGFSLVAIQMQKLAEQVMSSARDIEALTTDITKSTNASVLATEEANKLATETTKSAHQITFAVQQQEQGTQDASLALDEIAQVASEAAIAAHFVVEASDELIGLANDLNQSIRHFNI